MPVASSRINRRQSVQNLDTHYPPRASQYQMQLNLSELERINCLVKSAAKLANAKLKFINNSTMLKIWQLNLIARF